MKLTRLLLSLGWLVFALPVTCSDYSSNDLYTGGLTASSPGGRINPAEPWITNGGNGGGGGGR
jgi:hypothetical protein